MAIFQSTWNAPITNCRGLDTQAPITMAEEDDDHDHTGYHAKHPSTAEKDPHDKPKYKRQEFMRFRNFWKF